MRLTASWDQSTIFGLMNLAELHSVLALAPGIQVSLETHTDLLFVLQKKRLKKWICHSEWVTEEVFNINGLSSRTQLGHLYLTHSIVCEWIWIVSCIKQQPKKTISSWYILNFKTIKTHHEPYIKQPRARKMQTWIIICIYRYYSEISSASSLEEMSIHKNVWCIHTHKPCLEMTLLISIFARLNIHKCAHNMHVLLSTSLWSEL